MGEVHLDKELKIVTIFSDFITYGSAASEQLTKLMVDEVETIWNEPKVSILIDGAPYKTIFRIDGFFQPNLTPKMVVDNENPRRNFFRIEPFCHKYISFVDALGCNSGYFLYDNLVNDSTTAAHEYGHTLGLPHPTNLDLRGVGIPGLMYPRGTIVDAQYQYDPQALPGQNGGTMNPKYRQLWASEIIDLGIQNLKFMNNRAILGNFSNVFHPAHILTT